MSAGLLTLRTVIHLALICAACLVLTTNLLAVFPELVLLARRGRREAPVAFMGFDAVCRGRCPFHGNQSLQQRDAALGLAAGRVAEPVHCGFFSFTVFDRVRAMKLGGSCPLLVITVILESSDELHPPAQEDWERMKGCYFAFLDTLSLRMALTSSLARSHRVEERKEFEDRIHLAPPASYYVDGWRIIHLDPQELPYRHPRRNSRIPKMLPFRLFPTAQYVMYLDAKMRLRASPLRLLHEFVVDVAPPPAWAVMSNLRRTFIDEEIAWVRKMKPEAAKLANDQFAAYLEERRNRPYECNRRACPRLAGEVIPAQDSGLMYHSMPLSTQARGCDPRLCWLNATLCIEGSFYIADMQSSTTQLLGCNWFNEYMRFGERDQLPFGYVAHRMGLVGDGGKPINRSAGLAVIPRHRHWLNWMKNYSRPGSFAQRCVHRGLSPQDKQRLRSTDFGIIPRRDRCGLPKDDNLSWMDIDDAARGASDASWDGPKRPGGATQSARFQRMW